MLRGADAGVAWALVTILGARQLPLVAWLTRRTGIGAARGPSLAERRRGLRSGFGPTSTAGPVASDEVATGDCPQAAPSWRVLRRLVDILCIHVCRSRLSR